MIDAWLNHGMLPAWFTALSCVVFFVAGVWVAKTEHKLSQPTQPKPLVTFRVELRLHGTAAVPAAYFSSDELWTKFYDPDERVIVMYKTEDVKSVSSLGKAAA